MQITRNTIYAGSTPIGQIVYSSDVNNVDEVVACTNVAFRFDCLDVPENTSYDQAVEILKAYHRNN